MGLRDKLKKQISKYTVQNLPPAPKPVTVPAIHLVPTATIGTKEYAPAVTKEKPTSKVPPTPVITIGKIGKRIGVLKGMHLIQRDGEGRIIIDIKSNVMPSQIVLHLYKLQPSEVLVINLPKSKGRY